ALGVALGGVLSGMSAFAALPDACKPVEEACLKAGYKEGGAKEGLGLYVHCVKPITKMPGEVHVKAKADKKPPKVAAAAVAKCKTALIERKRPTRRAESEVS